MRNEEVWDQNVGDEEEIYDDYGNGNTFIRVNRMNYNVDPGTNFKDTILNYARDAGLGKFRLFLDGEEIKPSQAPEVIGEGMKMELRPYDVAG